MTRKLELAEAEGSGERSSEGKKGKGENDEMDGYDSRFSQLQRRAERAKDWLYCAAFSSPLATLSFSTDLTNSSPFCCNGSEKAFMYRL